METIARQVELYRKEADIDFISLGNIAGNVAFYLKPPSLDGIRSDTLSVIKGLMKQGIRPGNYTLESLAREGFSFWPGEPEEQLKRIEDEWKVLDRMPDDDDICWFALKSTSGKS